MQEWLYALRSGLYEQEREFLVTEDGACCLGVLALVDGIDLLEAYQEPSVYGIQDTVDDELKIDVLPAAVAGEFGLDEIVTKEEFDYVIETTPVDSHIVINVQNKPIQRQHLLAHINDNGASFETVAHIIEQLGWDRL